MEEQTYVEAPMDVPGEQKDNKVWIIVGVVAVVLCCCCVAAGAAGVYLWNNGDEIFGLTSNLVLNLL